MNPPQHFFNKIKRHFWASMVMMAYSFNFTQTLVMCNFYWDNQLVELKLKFPTDLNGIDTLEPDLDTQPYCRVQMNLMLSFCPFGYLYLTMLLCAGRYPILNMSFCAYGFPCLKQMMQTALFSIWLLFNPLSPSVVLRSKEKIETNCYKFKTKHGSFVTLQSQWFSFVNPWTKEVEYIVSTNTVISWVYASVSFHII